MELLSFLRALLYWSDWGNDEGVQARIERAHFDGSQRATVVTFDRGVVPLDITVDISTSILYWVASNGTIGACNSLGEGRRIVYVSETPNIDGITIVGDYIYWIDKTAGSVWKASTANSNNARKILKGLTELQGISSVDVLADPGIYNMVHACFKFIYFILGESKCQFNGPCSHLCLSNGVKSRCACPPGLILSPHGAQCNSMY